MRDDQIHLFTDSELVAHMRTSEDPVRRYLAETLERYMVTLEDRDEERRMCDAYAPEPANECAMCEVLDLMLGQREDEIRRLVETVKQLEAEK